MTITRGKMSWLLCKKKWMDSPSGKIIKKLTGKELFDIPELKDICDKFRRGYYTDDQFQEILVAEIKDLRGAKDV